jgi:hypothetical protein
LTNVRKEIKQDGKAIMNNANTPTPTDVQKEGQVFSLKSVAARNLRVTPQDIRLVNAESFVERRTRFLYGFTEPAGKIPGFFKMSQTPEHNRQLERESIGIAIAHRIGISTVDIIHPFQNTPEGYGILHVERLDTENGTILTSPEFIARLEESRARELGARAAMVLAAAGGREIPSDIDSSILNREDWRNQSPETFWRVWEEQNNIVFSPEYTELVNRLIRAERLRTIVNETRTAIEHLINSGTNLNIEYFVHNDATPNNIFFSDIREDALLLDFEHAAASYHLVLAQLTDVGNYYGRMWPNPAMQQEFLTTYLAQSTPKTLDHTYQLLRASTMFGAMYLTKYGVKKGHPENPMSVSLLSNLEGNLASLDQQYNVMKVNNNLNNI